VDTSGVYLWETGAFFIIMDLMAIEAHTRWQMCQRVVLWQISASIPKSLNWEFIIFHTDETQEFWNPGFFLDATHIFLQ